VCAESGEKVQTSKEDEGDDEVLRKRGKRSQPGSLDWSWGSTPSRTSISALRPDLSGTIWFLRLPDQHLGCGHGLAQCG
jgi:hypothetical protein